MTATILILSALAASVLTLAIRERGRRKNASKALEQTIAELSRAYGPETPAKKGH